ncbi:YafY family protein [Sphingomonas swuensis]|uniref:YafY family protein n=1 Tax=Sphingomonas swuensis TaxID=977800 RepID=A0ABP7T072_9SPHN
MGDARKAPFDRLLQLVRGLSETTDGLTLDEIAEVLGQGRRSAERARDVIALNFDLDEIVDGPRKRFRIVDGLRRHYTRPSAEELAALRAEVDAMRSGGSLRFQQLQSLLSKVQASFDDRERRRIEPDLEELLKHLRAFSGPGPVAMVAPEVTRAALDAIMSGQCLEFDYQTLEADAPRWRRIACAGLLNGPVSYAVGFMPGRDGAAVYRLDRMSNARVSDELAALPEDFELDDWLADGFGIWREEPRDIVLRVFAESAARARQWRFHPRQRIEEQADGALLISFRTGGLREIADHLFQWAGQIEIVAPEELQDVMEDRLELAWSIMRRDDDEEE